MNVPVLSPLQVTPHAREDKRRTGDVALKRNTCHPDRASTGPPAAKCLDLPGKPNRKCKPEGKLASPRNRPKVQACMNLWPQVRKRTRARPPRSGTFEHDSLANRYLWSDTVDELLAVEDVTSLAAAGDLSGPSPITKAASAT